ncbi:MAG: NUDIX hydrolase [Candidatus Saccharimonadales bacterium]
MDFTGVKIALIYDNKLLVIQRDNKPGLRFAGLWDFPGGGREGNETPFECVSREVMEELGIELKASSIIWQSTHPAMHDPKIIAYFMVSNISQADIQSIHFGDEGQGWKLISIDEFMQAGDVVEPLKARLQTYLDSKSIPGSNAANSATN